MPNLDGYDPHCPTCKELRKEAPMRTSDDVEAESAVKISRSHYEARLSRRILAAAGIVIVFQWAIIVWLAWFQGK